jgi:hypothetical protein
LAISPTILVENVFSINGEFLLLEALFAAVSVELACISNMVNAPDMPILNAGKSRPKYFAGVKDSRSIQASK